MAGMITDLGSLASGSVDRTADLLEIVDLSANTSYKITVNALVGISGGAVVSTTDSQSLTNKTLDNTNALTIKDGSLTLQNTASTTKQAVFSAASITAGQTRTFTFPDVSGTIVLLAATQTLTNKTLTSPAITGGTIDNSAITVDSIGGHTSATIVTVAGLQINNGIVGSNGVATASIADTAVTPAKLQSGTGSGWAWSTWAPSWGSFTVGNGVLSYAKYIQIGKTVHGRLRFVLGSTSAVTGAVNFSLPVNFNSDYVDFTYRFESALEMRDVSAGVSNLGLLTFNTSSTAALQQYATSGSNLVLANVSSIGPMTWATGDIISCGFKYETT